MKDKRPDPKPRKHPRLWQSYLWWDEMVKLRQRHTLRLSSIEKGKSNMDAQFERDTLDGHVFVQHVPYKTTDGFKRVDTVNEARKEMIRYGQDVGPIWDWVTSHKGLAAGGLAAQLLAQFDDVSKFATVSKFWRFSGWGVIDGQIDRCKKGEKSLYNRRLKSICYLIADQFIKQQTPIYVDIYYAEKERQRRLHPEKIKVNGKWKYNDGHLHHRAMRKMIKIFLQHVWIKWREFEDLPVSKPWVHDVAGHTHYISPPE